MRALTCSLVFAAGCASSASDWTSKDTAAVLANAQLDLALARACEPEGGATPVACSPGVVRYAECASLDNNAATLSRHAAAAPDAGGACP